MTTTRTPASGIARRIYGPVTAALAGALSANVSIFNGVATVQPRTVGVDLNYRF